MGRTIGAAIGAIIVFLFFVLGIDHSRVPSVSQSSDAPVSASARR